MAEAFVTLPGDGVGPEIMESVEAVLESVGNFTFREYDFGGVAIDGYGDPFPQVTKEACRQAKVVLLGAVGGPKWESNDPEAPRPEQGLLKLRQGLHANLRPVCVIKSMARTSRVKGVLGTDFVIVRDIAGGIYTGNKGRNEKSAFDTCEYTSDQVINIGRTAFELARTRSVDLGIDPRVTSIDKANVLETSKLWREKMSQLQEQEYPEVELSHMLVDNAAQQLIKNPKQFDVIVTENMFGDILSDEAAMLTGSIGLLPSASLNKEGQGVFEPVHGSAPDIAGKNEANPIAMILSGALALRHIGMASEARAIELAVEETLNKRIFRKGVRTPDLGGMATTRKITDAVIRNIPDSF